MSCLRLLYDVHICHFRLAPTERFSLIRLYACSWTRATDSPESGEQEQDRIDEKMGTRPSNYERRLQIKHFFEDRSTGQTRRTWLEIQFQPPEKSEEGWVNEGKVRLTLGEDRDIKGAFLLSISETARLIKALELIVEDHELEAARLWRE